VDSGKVNSTEPDEVDIDANPRVMGGRVDMGGDEDFPHCDPNYPDWVTLGRPNCWMWPYQCDGDADGINSGVPFYYRVYTGDMALIIQNWRKKMGAPGLNPCADIDHISSGAPNYYRVYTGDMYRIILARPKGRNQIRSTKSEILNKSKSPKLKIQNKP
jgi:hypothetical protein